ESWERILFANDEAGAVDLVIDPGNPRVLFASTWRIKRTPYSLESGGEGSALWKSSDGGNTWTDISRNSGLPQKSILGIIGVTISPVDSDRMWALVEAEDGGLFRTDDGGESWTKVNDERKLRQRAWYYTRVYADTQNRDKVYVLNVQFHRSTDGGKTFSSIRTPHGDHHDLWIDPEVPDRMVIADDGGGQVTYNGGINWSTYMNQPTAQFYRVTTDNHFPYRIYGAQQDNSTVRIASRGRRGSIGERDWEPTAGGESGHIAPHPENPEIVYGGSYGGYLARLNHETGENRNVNIWPDNPIGRAIKDVKYRFQWNFPIFFSPHDPNTLYSAANVLFKSTDEGQSWTPISPDLTRDDKSRQGSSGGPITKDNTGVEVYCTIFAAAESHLEPGLLWAGSDDGLIHVSRDGGENWESVTPPDLPEWAQINSIEVHPTKEGGLYVAATRYKSDDFKPYLLKTTDYGATWTMINDGIDAKHFTRVVRADPGREGLLYAGTENGMYVSFDDGANWEPFQLNLPIVPVTDLAIKDNDLVVATQGRSFWVLDDLTVVHQWRDEVVKEDSHLFESRPVYRGGRGFGRSSLTAGANPRGGVTLRYWMRDVPEDTVVKLEIKDGSGDPVKTFSTKPDEDMDEDKLNLESGLNETNWNLRYAGAETFPGMVLWGGGTQGPGCMPGKYQAVLSVGDESTSIEFEVMKDPRLSVTDEEYQAQFEFLIGIRDKLTETHMAIKRIRDVRSQLNTLKGRLGDDEQYEDLVKQVEELVKRMTTIEETLYQTKSQSGQDPLNFPIRLNNRLSALVGVVSSADGPPTRQAIEVHDLVVAEIDENLADLQKIFDEDVAGFNNEVSSQNVPAIFTDDDQAD
ncbi:MAG: WD40/YVTN/BNR-like repeat-containing protein, partial [Pirellulaceae bacterium]